MCVKVFWKIFVSLKHDPVVQNTLASTENMETQLRLWLVFQNDMAYILDMPILLGLWDYIMSRHWYCFCHVTSCRVVRVVVTTWISNIPSYWNNENIHRLVRSLLWPEFLFLGKKRIQFPYRTGMARKASRMLLQAVDVLTPCTSQCGLSIACRVKEQCQ